MVRKVNGDVRHKQQLNGQVTNVATIGRSTDAETKALLRWDNV